MAVAEMTPTGMSLTLTSEHEMIRQAARDFAQNEIAPIAGREPDPDFRTRDDPPGCARLRPE